MGAETTVYLRVLRTFEDWIEVDAVTLEEAERKGETMPGVVKVLESTYDLPPFPFDAQVQRFYAPRDTDNGSASNG